MALKTSFLNDREYGADDVNAIISRIVGQGVSPEYDGIVDARTYNLDRLNDLTKSYVERGVAYQGDPALKVIRIDGVYYISPGTAFFGNGTVTEVTENERVEIKSGVQCYIYMVSSVANNSNHIEVSETAPDYHNDSNIVPLARVDADGNITDMRFYARGKLPGFQNENYGLKKINFTIPTAKSGTTGTITLDLGTEHLSMLLVHTPPRERYSDRGLEQCLNVLILDGEKTILKKMLKGDRADIKPGNFYLHYYESNDWVYTAVLEDIKRVEGSVWELSYTIRNSDSGRTDNMLITMYYV